MKKWIVPVLTAALVFASMGILVHKSTTQPYDAPPNAVSQAQESAPVDTYRLGQTFTVPARSFATDAGDVPATAVLIAPDGKATVSTEVVLDRAGKWTIRYAAKANGKVYSDEVFFLVLNDAYSLSSTNSSAVYERYTQHGSDSEGLQVKLAMNDTLTFEKVIDLNQLGATDTLIRGFATPTRIGVADFGRFIFTLTDAEDPSVYMQITGNRYKISNERGVEYTYFTANGNGQYATGIERGNVHVADGLGTPVSHSFVAQRNSDGWAGPVEDIVPDEHPFIVTFDRNELIVTVNGTMVIDLDDAVYFEELWFGFPSNKVRLSVSAGLYNAATANFCLTDVFGIDLTEPILYDREAPVITVQADDCDDMPEGRVGATYPIPAATAVDEVSGVCETDVKVYYNSLSEYPVAVPVVNGRFTTDCYGDYAIVYTAADAMGNTAQKVLNVHAGRAIPALTVTCPDNTPVELGYTAQITAPLIYGGSGATSWTATATLGGATVDATNGFYPETAGDWTITYTAVDYIGTEAKASGTLTVTAGNKPVLPASVGLPGVLIAGAAYTLPEAYAKDYTSGSLVQRLCDVEIVDGNGTATYKAGESFKPAANQSGDKITVTYTCGAARSEPYEVAVIDPWGENNLLNVGAYFYGEGFTAEVKDDNGVIISSAGSQDFTWTFANAQLAENASVVLKSVAWRTDCEGFEILFTDAGDSSTSIGLRLMRDGSNKTQVTVGERTITLARSWTGSRSETFEVRYASRRLYIGTTGLDISTDTLGRQFTGFQSDTVFVSVRAIGVTPYTQYLVGAVSGCTFTTYAYDVDAPKITVMGDYGGTYAVGDVYTIAPAIANDVYCPNVTLTMTVTDPQGNAVRDVNGLTLSGVKAVSYTILLSEHGQYKVSYTASEVDWKNRMGRPNTATSVMMVNVLDSQAPVVTFKHSFAVEASVGDTLVIPDFTVTDDVTAPENIVVMKYVVNPDGKLIALPGNSVKCEYAGEYEFRIIVRDEAGNTNLYTSRVQVR